MRSICAKYEAVILSWVKLHIVCQFNLKLLPKLKLCLVGDTQLQLREPNNYVKLANISLLVALHEWILI